MAAGHHVNRLIEGLIATCGHAPLADKWLVCPSRRVGQQWLDQVALAATGVGHVRLHTLRSIAIAIARKTLIQRNLRFLPEEAGPLLVAQLWPQTAGPRDGYLGVLEPSERLYRALFRSIRDLRLAGTSDLAKDAFNEPRKAVELQELLDVYVTRLNALGRVDSAALMELASQIVLSSPESVPSQMQLLVPDDLYGSLTGREQQLIDSMASALGSDRFVKLPTDPSPIAIDHQSSETVAPAAPTRTQTRFFRAIGSINEVREAVRRTIATAGQLDRIELLHTDSATYVPLIYETAARLQGDELPWNKGMPVTFAEGINASMTRPGRALAAWLKWMDEDFAQATLYRILVDGLIAIDPIDRSDGRDTALARCLRSIPIGRGLDRYTMIRDQRDVWRQQITDKNNPDQSPETTEPRSGDGEERLAEYERLWRLVKPLCELSATAQTGPLALIDAASILVEQFSRQTNEFDALARQHLAERIDRLRADLGHELGDSVPEDSDARQWLEAIVHDSRVGGSGPQPGHLHVAHVDRGGHSGRTVTAIIGLDDARYPGSAFQDPVLLDGERRRLNEKGGPSLRESFDAPARRRASFEKLLGRLRGEMFLGFSCLDVIDKRELFPSPLLIDTFRIVVGDPDAEVERLIEACGPAASFVPGRGSDPIDLNEWWVAQLTTDRRVDDAGALLAKHFPNLHRGRTAAANRCSTAFTEYDGRVDRTDPMLAPTHQDGPIVSASRLEVFGTCPLRYFFRYVLRIDPPAEMAIDPDRWLDPMAFGQLLHQVFHQFMIELVKAEKRAEYDRDIDRLRVILDETVCRFRHSQPPANEQSYRIQRRQLEEAVDVFLTEEQIRSKTWRPRYLEASIGMPPGTCGTAIDRTDPVLLTLPNGKSIRIRARVDRIDQRDGTSEFDICDYKTGRATARYIKPDPFAGGRSLQHFLYLHVVASVLRQVHGDGAAANTFHYFFPSPEQHGRRIHFNASALADGLDRIAAMSEQIERGAFVQTEDPQDCNYCDYRTICSATHASLMDAAKQNRLKRLEHDQEVLAPMQAWRPLKNSTRSKPAENPRQVDGGGDQLSLPGASSSMWPGELSGAATESRGALPDQDERDQILQDLDTNMLVEAAAGTGKTTMMVGRMLQLVRTDRCTVDRMAAVTFTRKAASELRDRFHSALRRAVSETTHPVERRRLLKARDALDRCFVGTIHSFCSVLLRGRPVEAGVDIGFEEIDEAADVRLKRQSWHDTIDRLRAENDPLLEALERVGLDPSDLTQAYVKICDYPDVDRWPLRCDARPDDQPVEIDQETLDLGWAEVRRFVNDMRSTAAAFPREGGRLMQSIQRVMRMVDRANRGADPKLRMAVFEQFQEFDPTKSNHMSKTKWPGDDPKRRGQTAMRACEWWNRIHAKYAAPLIDNWRQVRYAPAMNLLLAADDACTKARAAAGVLNYQDLLLRTRDLLRRHPDICADFARRTTHLLVDEFQDTDPIQAEILFLLAAETEAVAGTGQVPWSQRRPRPGALFVVGDPKQSIYRFRRADIETYNLARRLIEQCGGRRVNLRANFRSSAAIVNWVNEAFRDLLPAHANRFSPAYQRFGIGRADGNEAQLRGVCALDVAGAGGGDKTAQIEAELIARIIRNAVDGGITVCRSEQELANEQSPRANFGDFMVISRGKARLGLYARALERYGIPHEVTGGSALNNVPQLAQLHTCLQAVLHAEDSTALVAALRSELFGISDAVLYAFSRAGGIFCYRSSIPQRSGVDFNALDDAFSRLRRYARWLDLTSPITAIERIAADLGLQPCAALDEGGDVQAGSMARAIELLRAAARKLWTAVDLANYLGMLIDPEAEDAELHDGMPVRTQERPVVRVMNLHKAKGLEAPVVFLADPCGEKQHPITMHIRRHETQSAGRSSGFMAIHGPTSRYGQRGALLARPPGWEAPEAEEQKFEQAETIRLLYVAATRAGSQLVVSRRTDVRSRHLSPWHMLEPYLEDRGAIPVPKEDGPPNRASLHIAPTEPGNVLKSIITKRTAAADPSYVTATAKRLGMDAAAIGAPAAAHDIRADNTHDTHDTQSIHEEVTLTAPTQWGQTIHMLLQIAAHNQQIDLVQEARDVLRQFDGHERDAPEAAEVVRRVMQSDVWQRSQRSSSRYTEVPFCIGDELEGRPRIIRGAIDLVFREDDRWIVVDYKTDRIDEPPSENLLRTYRGQLAVYKRAWSILASAEPTQIDTAIYFTVPDLLIS